MARRGCTGRAGAPTKTRTGSSMTKLVILILVGCLAVYMADLMDRWNKQ